MRRLTPTKSFLLPLLLVVLFAGNSCQKENSYFKNSGLANPYFKGSIVDYLDANPFYFDSVALVVRLAGLDSVVAGDTVTFFAPTDRSIMRLVKFLNAALYQFQYDTIRTLSDVPENIWRKYLGRYIFHGANQLRDYPQIDYDLRVTYPGQAYLSWNKTPMNIGVVYNDQNGVKYVGYRQLSISYIPDVSNPMNFWITAFVASSNILTDNGVVHVLSDDHTYFGFSSDEFLSDLEIAIGNGGQGN